MSNITACPRRHDPPKAVAGQPWVRGRDCPWCWHRLAATVPVHTPLPNPEPLEVVKLDGSRLFGGRPPTPYLGHSNAGILRWRDKLICVYRHKWLGARLYATELDSDTYQPTGPGRELELRHPLALAGQEDARLVEYRGLPCVFFSGVSGKLGPCSQLYATLKEDLSVGDVFCPGPRRGNTVDRWEKNWSPFLHDGLLYAVKNISPRHVVVRIDGHRTRVVADVSGPTWTGGLLRGGAPPVRHGDQYLSWFHGHVRWMGRKTYTTGLYSFEAKPPFRPLHITHDPVVYGDSRTRPKGWVINNFFPCGALLEDGEWLVSAGYHDMEVALVRWDAKDVCGRTTPVRLAAPAANLPKKPCGC